MYILNKTTPTLIGTLSVARYRVNPALNDALVTFGKTQEQATRQ